MPAQRSTTCCPPTNTAQAAPTSPRWAKFSAKASATFSNPSATDPCISTVMPVPLVTELPSDARHRA